MEKYKFIYNKLKEIYPNASCELEYKDAYSILVAVILSAQCTDKRVNQVTPKLFEKYPTVFDLANAEQLDVEQIIYPCGFYRVKAKNIILSSKDVVEKYKGQVPNNLNDLISLKGVGRKTANVVLSTVYNVPAIAVDTHVFRVSNRVGLANADNVKDCEVQLMNVLPKQIWSEMHQMMVLFGRYICKSQNPKCDICPFKDCCKR